MALTNGITLVNKIKTIADAIRRRTPNVKGNLTIDQMVNEIDNEWKIKCYVKDFYIQDDGNHGEGRDGDWDDCFQTFASGSPIMISYTTNGEIILTAQSKVRDAKNIWWTCANSDRPSGVSVKNMEWDHWSPTGNFGNIQSCIISGVQKNCRIIAWCGSRDEGNKSTIRVHFKIEYI